MKHDGCPEGMYPVDSDYPPNKADSLEELIADAESVSDVLNFPISWFISPVDGDDDPAKFQLVFLMPRKHSTFSIYTENFDRDDAESWVLDFTKRAATEWFGWD